MSKPLTADLILQRTKAGTLESVKNLNLWGNDIDDVRILKEMPNLEVLSLSVNKIATLKPFQYCKKLSELYLRKNLIADLSEIKYIQNLPGLKVLWLWDNPCAEVPNYREIVISALPNLVKLDNQAISAEEKTQISSRDLPPRNRREEKKEVEVVKQEPLRRERDVSPAIKEEPRARPRRDNDVRLDNVLCAVLALIKELDENSLEVVKREIDKRILEINHR
jgi:cilla- and flagella-associated protein